MEALAAGVHDVVSEFETQGLSLWAAYEHRRQPDHTMREGYQPKPWSMDHDALQDQFGARNVVVQAYPTTEGRIEVGLFVRTENLVAAAAHLATLHSQDDPANTLQIVR